jgi:hypothetical protein
VRPNEWYDNVVVAFDPKDLNPRSVGRIVPRANAIASRSQGRAVRADEYATLALAVISALAPRRSFSRRRYTASQMQNLDVRAVAVAVGCHERTTNPMIGARATLVERQIGVEPAAERLHLLEETRLRKEVHTEAA